MRRALVAVVVMLLTGGWVAGDGPQIAFRASQVVATGLTPGGQVVWFSVSKERREWMAAIVRRDRVDTADATGNAGYALDAGVSPVSVWVIADLATGLFAAATPLGMPTHVVQFPNSGLMRQGADEYGFSDKREALEVLLVRPGQGAWRLSVFDGGPSDDDHAANRVVVPAPRLFRSLLPGDNPLHSFRKGDVLLAIDPETFDHYAAEIGKPER